MNDLEKIFRRHNGRLIDKWSNYFEIYDRHFSRYRGTDLTLVEFGVFQGGSLGVWQEYFGPKASIVGIDINPACKVFEDDRTKIIIGDQGDARFLESIKEQVPHIDILIDDASHFVAHQILTFKTLFSHIAVDGIYLCEDNHTSYWPEYGGKNKGRGSYIEFTKCLIDELHGWHATGKDSLSVTDFTRTAHSMHYYDSVLAIEKRLMHAPVRLRVGSPSLPVESFDQSFKQGLKSRLLRMTTWLR